VGEFWKKHDSHAEYAPSVLSRLGDQVTIQGRVQNVSLVNASDAANIELAGESGPHTVLIWVPPDVYPKAVAAFGVDLAKALAGHPIRVTGRLGHYGGKIPGWKGRFQITLDDPSKLELASPTEEAKLKQP
jgi:hypothetical protein